MHGGGGRQPVGGGHGDGGIAHGHRRDLSGCIYSSDALIGAGKGQIAGEMLRRHHISQRGCAIGQV